MRSRRECGPRRRRAGLRGWIAARLRRRLFVWFGVAIALTVAVAALIGGVSNGGAWREQQTRLRGFMADRFALVWDDPARRAELAQATARALDARLRLSDANDVTLSGTSCDRPEYVVDVRRDGRLLGHVAACLDRRGHGPFTLFASLFAAALVLWGVSGRIARRIGRPLEELARVAREIGDGKLSARVGLGRHVNGEVEVVAVAVNDMAARIEKQIGDQRELLAAVSHEIRTPLARLRVLAELARDGGATPATLDGIEREIADIDALVGELSASARLDFAAPERRELDACDVALTALERASLPATLLRAPSGPVPLNADPTLLARALANLLANAARHAGGAQALVVRAEEERVTFGVEDAGAGFDEDTRRRAFEPFFRGGEGATTPDAAPFPSLGLGLALVQRIARAHGGDAWVEDHAGGGSVVCFSLQSGANRAVKTNVTRDTLY